MNNIIIETMMWMINSRFEVTDIILLFTFLSILWYTYETKKLVCETKDNNIILCESIIADSTCHLTSFEIDFYKIGLNEQLKAKTEDHYKILENAIVLTKNDIFRDIDFVRDKIEGMKDRLNKMKI